MNKKVAAIGIVMLVLLLGAGSISTAYQGMTSNTEISIDVSNILRPTVRVRTDSFVYDIGEPVQITYTNTGDVTVGFVIGIARPTIPWIIQVSTGRPLLLTDPLLCYPCVMMYGILEPDESLTVIWDQQYFGYINDPFTPSEQVPEGRYVVEFGYWEVTGYYDPPYYVPGGPPEHYARARFAIQDI